MKTIQINEPFYHIVYIGTAAEKAAILSPGAMDEFLEIDTGTQYRWNGISWSIPNPTVSQISVTSSGVFIASTVYFAAAIAADVDAAVVGSVGLRLIGYSAQETATVPGPAEFGIVHGATVAGTRILTSQLSANGVVNAWFGPDGIVATNGLSIDRVSGTFDLSLYYKVVA